MSDDLRRTPFETANALPVGTRLGEFEVRAVLGIGGFGIVYLAFDHDLEREVAVKEYMPASMAGRTETMHVSLRSQSDAEVFALGLRSFVNEAKLLARFDHPSLLKVFRFWEANGTAYMAMPVLRGRTLKDIRQGRQSLESPIDERWLRRLLDPLLGALDKLHSEGVYHRDIAPDNILIEPDGRPVLLDFGAARRVISDRTQTLTAILKPAYAPIEQYAEAGSVKQGPWTDLYALGATLHYLLLGQPPAPATARAVNEDHEPPLASRKIDGCSAAFLSVIDWMLAPRPGDRPQSVTALREVLAGRAPVPPLRAAAAAPAPWEPTAVMPQATTPPPAAKSPPPGPAATGPDEPFAADDSTVVVPPSRPPTRPHAQPPSQPPATPPARAASPSRTPSPTPSPSSAAAPSAGRAKAVPIAIGVVALVAVAAFALWPRASVDPAAPTPAAAAPAAATVAAPPVAVAASETTAATTAPAPVAKIEPAPPSVPAPMAPAVPAPVAPAVTAARPAPPAPAASFGAVTAKPSAAPATPKPATAAASTPPATQRAAVPGGAAAPRPYPYEPTPPAQRASPATAPAAVTATPATAQPYATGTPAAAPPATAPPATGYGATTPPAPEAPPASAKPDSPEARCGGRNPVLYFACMERECYRAQFRQHPECLEWHKNARQRGSFGN